MKIRMTVIVDLKDQNVYELDDDGWAIGEPLGPIGRVAVGEYVRDAVSAWGGQFAAGDPLFSSNIRSVRVQGIGFDISTPKEQAP